MYVYIYISCYRAKRCSSSRFLRVYINMHLHLRVFYCILRLQSLKLMARVLERLVRRQHHLLRSQLMEVCVDLFSLLSCHKTRVALSGERL